MARLRFRSIYNNRWLDSCKNPSAVRSNDNRYWIPLNIKNMNLRDGGDLNWLPNDCKPDPLFDDPCAFKNIASVNCPSGIDTMELGSGDGVGSDGEQFNIFTGYPAGYDLPDAGESGFIVEKDPATVRGYAIKRPALNYAAESYDPSGVTSNLGRGSYDNPNYLGATTFSSGTIITETIYKLGQVAGWFEIPFASYDEDGISVDVYYLGQRIATTCGRIKDRYKIEFFFDPVAGEGEDRIMIRIRGGERTRWTYMVIGPKQNLAVMDLNWEDPAHALIIRTDEYSGTPVFPAPCHATVFPREYKTNDGKWFYEFHHYVGENPDLSVRYDMVVDYTSWMNLDKFEVYHGGLRIGSTMDPQAALGMIKFLWDPTRFYTPVPDLMIRVSAETREYGQDIMSWYYTLFCQNTIGYRAAPWPCETPVAGVSSMGHGSTEDNYDMTTDISRSVVSIKTVGYGDFDYTISVFDIEGNLIVTQDGKRTTFTQFFILKDEHLATRDRIAVRIDAPIGSSWVYYVGCPVALIDIELDDKIVPVCQDDIEITVNDVQTLKQDLARFTITTNLPVPVDTTVVIATRDGTAVGSATGVASNLDVYGILIDGTAIVDGTEGPATTTARFMVQNQAGYTIMFDNGWGNLANPAAKNAGINTTMGRNTNLSENIETSTFNMLSVDGRILVNAWKHKYGSLTGKRWLILTDASELYGSFGDIASNFIQSMVNIYSMQVTVVLNTEYESQNFSAYDIITIANSRRWGEEGQYGAAGVHYMARVLQGFKSPLGIQIANAVKQGKILHCVLRGDNQRIAGNILIQDVMNSFTGIKFRWDGTKMKKLLEPTNVLLADHLTAFPNTPLLAGVTEAKMDTDLEVIDMDFIRADPVADPDYVSKSESVIIPAGFSSLGVNVTTLNPSVDPSGKDFFLDLVSSSNGTIVDPEGRALFVNRIIEPPSSADLRFTRDYLQSRSRNFWQEDFNGGGYPQVFGCACSISIDYSVHPNNLNPSGSAQPGSIAGLEADGGLASVSTPRSYLMATYPYDPALTYDYKWQYQVVRNEQNISLTFPSGADVYSVSNRHFLVSMDQSAVLTDNSGMPIHAIVEAILFIRASNGVEYKSNIVTMTLVSDPVFPFGQRR